MVMFATKLQDITMDRIRFHVLILYIYSAAIFISRTEARASIGAIAHHHQGEDQFESTPHAKGLKLIKVELSDSLPTCGECVNEPTSPSDSYSTTPIASPQILTPPYPPLVSNSPPIAIEPPCQDMSPPIPNNPPPTIPTPMLPSPLLPSPYIVNPPTTSPIPTTPPPPFPSTSPPLPTTPSIQYPPPPFESISPPPPTTPMVPAPPIESYPPPSFPTTPMVPTPPTESYTPPSLPTTPMVPTPPIESYTPPSLPTTPMIPPPPQESYPPSSPPIPTTPMMPPPPLESYPPPQSLPPTTTPIIPSPIITYPPPPATITFPPPSPYAITPPTTSYPSPPPPYTPSTPPGQGLWCVAKPTMASPLVEQAMNFACGAGADCQPIQPNGACFIPNTVISHASYAFNSYWQMTKISGGSCDFGGTGMIVTVDPSYEQCHYTYNFD